MACPFIPLTEGFATGKTSWSPALKAQTGPGACCQTFVKSQEERWRPLPPTLVSLPPQTALGRYRLLAIYLFRFIQNKHNCSCMYSKDL